MTKFVVREMYQCDPELNCDHTDLSKEKIHTLTMQEALDKINDPTIHSNEYTPYDETDGIEELSSCLYDYCELEVVEVLT